MALGTPCSIHPERAAGWRCGTCGRDLCPACAVFRSLGQGRIEVCLPCGGAASALRDRRALLEPFSVETLRSAVRFAFQRESLLTALACGFVFWLLALAGGLAAFVAEGIVLAVLFHITSSTARGADGFENAGDFRGFFEDVLGPLFRAGLASIWAWGPVVFYVLARHKVMFEDGDLARPAGPEAAVVLLLLAAGTFLFPMALLVGAIGAPLRYLLNPMVVIGYALRLGKDYLLLAGFSVAVSVVDSLLLSLLLAIEAHVTALPGLVKFTLLLLPPIMLFRALGLLVRARGDELGYGGAEAYLVPVLGARQPDTEQAGQDRDDLLRAQLARALAEAPPEPALLPEPFDSAPADEERARAVQAAGAGKDVEEIELAREGSGLPPALQLAQKVTGRDAAGALLVWAEGSAQIPAGTLSQRAWVELGRSCLAQGQAALAVLALRRAIEVAPEGPLAPQALLQAARIEDEKLGDRARSNALLGELVARHPQSPEAQFAARRLQPRIPGQA